MSIPMWIKKDYTNDGCSIYQCLNCYKSWEARTNPEYSNWKYCPVCGIIWTQEKKSERPEWKSKRWVNDEEPLNPCQFIIEKRTIHSDGTIIPWQKCRNYYIRNKSDALYYLNELKQQENKLKQQEKEFIEDIPYWKIKTEYRISKKD